MSIISIVDNIICKAAYTAATRLDFVHVLRGPGDALVVGQLHAPHVRAQRHHVRHLERLRIPAIGRVNLSGARAARAALH